MSTVKYILTSCLILLAVLIMLVIPVARIPYHFYINYNEGWWNAYHAIGAWHGILYGNLFTPVNYPPLSFYFPGLFPEPLIAGRIVALLALFVNCFFVSLLVYKASRNKFASFISGILALGIFLGLAQYYVGMDDPQLLAQAIMFLGFVLYYFKKNLFLVALLIAVSLFIKNNLLAFPLAIIIDLFLINKKEMTKFIVYLAMLGIAGLVGFQVLFHGQFISSILTKREYTLTNVITLIKITILPIFPLMIVAALYRKRDLFFYYFIASLIVGVFFSIGFGVDVNINFDVFLSISILTGILLAKKQNLLFIVLIQILMLIGIRIYQHNLYYSISQKEQEALQTISIIRNTKGDALCEDIDLCYFAGKPFLYDPYLVNEEIKAKKIKESTILVLIKEKKFRVIQLHAPLQKDQGKFTKKFMLTLKSNYSLVNGLYIPTAF